MTLPLTLLAGLLVACSGPSTGGHAASLAISSLGPVDNMSFSAIASPEATTSTVDGFNVAAARALISRMGHLSSDSQTFAQDAAFGATAARSQLVTLDPDPCSRLRRQGESPISA